MATEEDVDLWVPLMPWLETLNCLMTTKRILFFSFGVGFSFKVLMFECLFSLFIGFVICTVGLVVGVFFLYKVFVFIM